MNLRHARSAIAFPLAMICATALAQTPRTVTVVHPVPRDVSYYEVAAKLEPAQRMAVRAAASGTVQQVHVQQGMVVKSGDLLVSLDPRDAQTRLQLAEQRHQMLTQALRQAEVALQQAPVPSPGTLAEANHARLLAEREVIVAQLELSRIDIEQVRRELTDNRVVAPQSGWVESVDVAQGDAVWASANSATLLCTLAQTDPVHASFELDEDTYLKLQSLTRQQSAAELKSIRHVARLSLDGSDFRYDGTVDCTDNRFDPSTRRIRFQGVFPNAEGRLTQAVLSQRPETKMARLRVTVGLPRRLLLVPENTVGSDTGGRSFVLVVNRSHTVEQRFVLIGALVDGYCAVESGLAADDLVVWHVERRAGGQSADDLSPEDFRPDVTAPDLIPGTRVKPLLAEPPAAAVPTRSNAQ